MRATLARIRGSTDVVNTYRVWLRYELFRGRLPENGLRASEANLSDYVRSRRDTKPHLAYVLVEEEKRASDAISAGSEIYSRTRSSSLSAN